MCVYAVLRICNAIGGHTVLKVVISGGGIDAHKGVAGGIITWAKWRARAKEYPYLVVEPNTVSVARRWRLERQEGTVWARQSCRLRFVPRAFVNENWAISATCYRRSKERGVSARCTVIIRSQQSAKLRYNIYK